MGRNVLIIAGEPSADLHASNLVRAVKEHAPGTVFFGTGGDLMAAAGVELIYHVRDLAVMGLVEVLKHLSFFRKVMRDCIALAEERKPDLIILVDYPGFNLRLAAALKKRMNVPVLYYIAPQLWAWGSGRVSKMKKVIDRLAVILPFEKDFFAGHGIRADYIGHPLVDAVKPTLSADAFRHAHRIPAGAELLGLLPGSRVQEVLKILPVMLSAAARLHERTGIRPVIAATPNVPAEIFNTLLPSDSSVTVCTGQAYDVMHHSRLVLTASGSATLEVAYTGTPMFILYRVAPLTWILGKMLVNLPYIGLVNIVAGREIVPEYLQKNMDPARIAADAATLLNDRKAYESMRSDLQKVKAQLGAGTPAQNGAAIVREMLEL